MTAPTATAPPAEDALVRPGAEAAPTVSICIPHYQVQDLMRLCLRALRYYTDGPPYEVIVVDNGSTDESLDWLRSMDWFTLVERGESTPENWIRAMNTALDLGLERARGDYYLIMHSDTIVRQRGWLRRMVEVIESGPQVASCGSGKLERRSAFAQLVRDATDTKRFRLWLRRTILRDASARQLTREPCPRAYCALYRTAALREHDLSFVSKGGYSAGETVYYDLKRHGYESSLIPVPEMMRNMDHIAHATGALLPERKLDRAHMFRKTRRRLKRLFHRNDVDVLLADDSLEH
jgi:glycosyltransferase involved in cell wall biosynthesis